MKKIIIITVLLSALLFSCKKPSSKKNKEKKENKKVTVMVETVKPRTLDKYIEVTGTLEGINDVSLISETAGKIAKINVKLGQWIEKGSALGTVDNASYKINLDVAKAALKSSQASLTAAKLNLDAAKSLLKSGNMSKAEYAQSESQFKGAESRYESAKATLAQAELAYENALFVAPVSGYVAQLNIQKGQYVSPGMPIAQIVNTKKLIIKTGAGEEDIVNIQKNQSAVVEYQGKSYKAIISGIGIKPINASYPVEIEVPNPKNLYPGMVVTVKIHSKSYNNAIYTSLNHIIKNYDQNYVYVIKDGKAIKRKVTLGDKVSENVIINDGLILGEKLVIEGMENIESGVTVVTKEL